MRLATTLDATLPYRLCRFFAMLRASRRNTGNDNLNSN